MVGLGVVAVGVEGAWRAIWRLAPGRLASQLETAFLILAVVTLAGGLGLLVGGGHPAEPLHFVYAIVALGLFPLADSLSRRSEPRTKALATVFAALIILVVVLRLFATG